MSKEKPKDKWAIKKGRVVECIMLNCSKIANQEGYCWKHYDEQQKYEW